jgi:hypothetical protein
MKDFPVDAGMIGVIPKAAMQRGDGGWPEGGMVIKVQGGRYLNLHYNDGRITITADLNGAVPVLEDTEFWVGDLCYVLESNIPTEDCGWYESTNPAPGYWAACVSSSETPRHGGCYFAKPFRLDGGMAGLVSSTQWGDGVYPGTARTEGEYTVCVTIETGDTFEDDEEEE